MGLATVKSRAAVGIEAPQVLCEVNLSPGLPMFAIVGLPETAVRESKDRVRAALKNSEFDLPSWRTTVSLAPADLPKEGSRFDLPIAVGVLAASGQVPDDDLGDWEFLGELSLTGRLRAIKGALPAILRAREQGRKLILPRANAEEAGLVADAEIYLAESLCDVAQTLNGRQALPRAEPVSGFKEVTGPDLTDVLGQHRARRALEIAAAGGHNLLLFGASGLGKSPIAAAVGHALIEQGLRVRYYPASSLVQELQTAKQALSLSEALHKLDKYRLLIIDDIGYVQRTEAETSVLFELIAHRYEPGSLLITSNHPFSAWDSIFPDNMMMMAVAAVDRLVHHADIIELTGESYRKRAQAARKKGEIAPAIKGKSETLTDRRF